MKRILLTALLVACMACPALANDKELVLYSSNPSELIDMACHDFEAETGIKVSAVRMGTGSAMKRIKAESARPLCDVFWSGDVAALDGNKEFFASYTSPQAAVLPKGYAEPEGRWTSTNAHVMIVMVNTSLIPEGRAPRKWSDLFSPEWKDKIVMANPEKSGSAYAQAYGLFKLHGWDGLKKLVKNAKILDSSSLIYKGVAAGEYPIGITMEYAAYRYIAGGAKDVQIIYPEEGAFVAPEGAAIVKNGPNPKAARMFVEYVLKKATQEKVFANFYRRPARPDATGFDGLPAISAIPTYPDFDPMEANAMKKEIRKKWKRLILTTK